MLKRISKIGLLALGLVLSGNLLNANAQSVNGSIGNGTVARGAVARGTVVFSLPGGLHANSNRPGSQYAIPTTVHISGGGVKIGPVGYPRGRNRKFEFSENTLNVYEGRVSFGFNVTVPQNYRGSSIRLGVTVRYQACTNEVCYPPASKQVTLTARVQ